MNPTEIEKTVLEALNNNQPNISDNYTLPDMLLYLTLHQIYFMFRNNTIPKSEGSKLKQEALSKYKHFAFSAELYKSYVDKIKLTESLRQELHKNPNLDTAIELIQIYSGEQFIRKDSVT